MLTSLSRIALVAIALLLASCGTSYVPPGARADLNGIAPQSVQAGFDLKPSYPFPSAIAVARLQAPSYSNYQVRTSGGTYGTGAYAVVLSREVEDEATIQRLARLPEVSGVVAFNRLLLPDHLNSDTDLRQAAARLQAGLVLIYTFDTRFFDANDSRALSSISLGFAPTKRINVVSTCSALLLDTRTGYLYSAYESTSKAEARSNVWDSSDSADALRRDTEKNAFEGMVAEVTGSWQRMLDRNKRP